MTRKHLLCVFMLCMLALQGAHAQQKRSDDDDDDDALAAIVDVVNVFMFLLAGGPEEVAIRLFVLVAGTIVIASVIACCTAIGAYDPDRRPGSAEKALTWGARGYTTYATGNELYANRSKWGL